VSPGLAPEPCKQKINKYNLATLIIRGAFTSFFETLLWKNNMRTLLLSNKDNLIVIK
jgi:hypothetical protein